MNLMTKFGALLIAIGSEGVWCQDGIAQKWVTALDQACVKAAFTRCFEAADKHPCASKPGGGNECTDITSTVGEKCMRDVLFRNDSICVVSVPDKAMWEILRSELICDFTKAMGQAFLESGSKTKGNLQAADTVKCK